MDKAVKIFRKNSSNFKCFCQDTFETFRGIQHYYSIKRYRGTNILDEINIFPLITIFLNRAVLSFIIDKPDSEIERLFTKQEKDEIKRQK